MTGSPGDGKFDSRYDTIHQRGRQTYGRIQHDSKDCPIQGGAIKTGPPAILSHCKYSENSMTELHGKLVDFCNII